MQLVTLTTDWGEKDHYIGIVKSKLYSSIDNCQVIDITHNIEKFNIKDGAFIIKNACLNYPKGTIHIIDIKSTEETKEGYQHIIIKYNEQYFICTDNGMPSLIFDDISQIKIIGLTKVYQDSLQYSFSALNLFCKVASLISYNTPIEEMGFEQNALIKRNMIAPIIYDDSIICSVLYVDSYGNVFLNIKIDEFLKILDGRKFSIKTDSAKITEISTSYADVQEGRTLLLVSASEYLQIAINNGNASELLALYNNVKVKIEIY